MKITEKSVFENASGYCRARIPGIVCLDSGTLVAYCELRQSDSDWAVIDVGMRKSYDGGKSWSERKIPVSGEGENTVNNPVMIADGNILHFLYCVNYSRVFYMNSTDEGENWSEARELTESIRNQTGEFFWSCIATGPTHGIKLSSGRLLVPVWLAYNKEDSKSHHPSVICVMYSDDSGNSWQLGEISDSLCDGSEFCIAEADNTVVANIRHEGNKKCRAVAEIDSFCKIKNIRSDENLPDPVCCAGLCSAGDVLLFSNCANDTSRVDLTLRKLKYNGSISDSLLISESGGYSDIAVSPDKKTAYVLYEYEKMLICATVNM